MTGALDSLFALAGAQITVAAMVFLRIGAVMALMPAFGERVVPMRLRLILGFAFTAVVAPAVFHLLPPPPDTVTGLIYLLLAETANGLALGMVIRLFILAIETAGGIAAQSGSLSQMFGAAGEPMPAISHLLIISCLCLALMAGLHIRLAQALILSYEAMPAGQFPAAGLMRDWGVSHIATTFALAFSLAAPFVIAALVYNVALGAINRAMPSLMVSLVGAPALTAGALALLAICAPLMLGLWLDRFNGFLTDPFLVAR
ncbi:MAG: flagellar biosynthetic protein FliR [Paracoccaceae bacterium]